MTSRHDRPRARVHAIHFEGIDRVSGDNGRHGGRHRLVDCPEGMRAGMLVFAWSEKREDWITCEVLPRSGRFYGYVTELKLAS